MGDCWRVRMEKAAAITVVHDQPAFSELSLHTCFRATSALRRISWISSSNSSEKRLARVLLLANFGKEGKPELVIPKMSRETLAEIVGTTRSRVSFFLNRFRKMGFIDDKDGGGSQFAPHVVLHD